MAIPAKIRVNTQVPFPSLVQSTAPATISKANGIWTIGLSIASLGTQVPAAPAYPTDYVLVWDSVNQTYFRMTIAALITAASTVPGGTRAQRLVTATPIVVAPTDQIINCKITTPAACALPSAASRLGVPLTFKDLGQAAANHITLSASGADLIDGLATAVLGLNYQAITLVPLNDGASVGWAIE